MKIDTNLQNNWAKVNMNVFLIGCSKTKRRGIYHAKNLYQGNLFKLSWQYASAFTGPKKIFILSAKYGLLKPLRRIRNYDCTLNNMRSEERKGWARNVLLALENCTDLNNDHFYFLAGEKYRQYLLNNIDHVVLTLKNLGKGNGLQMKKLKELLNA